MNETEQKHIVIVSMVSSVIRSLRKLQGGGSFTHSEYEGLIELLKKIGDYNEI